MEDILVLAPISDVSAQADHVILNEVQLTEAGLLVGLVEVALEGGEPLILVVDQHSDKILTVSSKQNTSLTSLHPPTAGSSILRSGSDLQTSSIFNAQCEANHVT